MAASLAGLLRVPVVLARFAWGHTLGQAGQVLKQPMSSQCLLACGRQCSCLLCRRLRGLWRYNHTSAYIVSRVAASAKTGAIAGYRANGTAAWCGSGGGDGAAPVAGVDAVILPAAAEPAAAADDADLAEKSMAVSPGATSSACVLGCGRAWHSCPQAVQPTAGMPELQSGMLHFCCWRPRLISHGLQHRPGTVLPLKHIDRTCAARHR